MDDYRNSRRGWGGDVYEFKLAFFDRSVRRQSCEVLKEACRRIETMTQIRERATATFLTCERGALRSTEEFREHRYGPFWESLEILAIKLSSLFEEIDAGRKLQETYSNLLRGYHHNLPLVINDGMPNAEPIVFRFRELVRRAQSDINFATIWEHRQTRAVMVRGFTTIGALVQDLLIMTVLSS